MFNKGVTNNSNPPVVTIPLQKSKITEKWNCFGKLMRFLRMIGKKEILWSQGNIWRHKNDETFLFCWCSNIDNHWCAKLVIGNGAIPFLH